MTTPTIQTTTRAAALPDLVTLLREQHARRVDIVAPARAIAARGGNLVVSGVDPVMDEDGVTDVNGAYLPTDVADGGLASKLDIPPAYLRRMRRDAIDLYDTNVNGWLQHEVNAGKRFLLRGLRGDDGQGVARAFLSDSYKPIDNLDVLLSALDGIAAAGVQVEIPVGGCDLTERRMYVKVWAPQVRTLAPVLLGGYRSPFDNGVQRRGAMGVEAARNLANREGQGYGEGNEPVVFAGFVISNSEVGQGAFQIAPQIVVQVCKNGLTVTGEAFRAQHLGAKLEEGVIRWSADTQEKQLALVRAQARDAVSTFLDADYVTAKVAELERLAAKELAEPEKAVTVVAKELRYSEDRQNDILRHFILGGQLTAGGVMQAVTSVAQTVADADEAAQMEGDGIRALELAAAI